MDTDERRFYFFICVCPYEQNYMSDATDENNNVQKQTDICDEKKTNFVWKIFHFCRESDFSIERQELEKRKEKVIEKRKEKLIKETAETELEETAKWNKEFDRLNKSFEFYTDFGLKVVAFFYLTVGGILSISFREGGDAGITRFVLLVVPIIMSLILGYYFLYGASILDKDAKYMLRLAEKLKFEELTKVELLSEILRVFGVMFFITGAFLIVLLISMICC